VTPPRGRRAWRAALLPSPWLSTALLVTWLMLSESSSAGHLALGATLALAIPALTRATRPDPVHVRRPARALGLALVVLWDVVRSNVEVARRVLGPTAAIRSRFVEVPLEIRHPYGIATLAAIVTTTPGTVSADLSDDRSRLLVHALHCDDPAALVAEIKARYEAPLREIFE
jgi:multicomponent K+:H+ antiporter subunit E